MTYLTLGTKAKLGVSSASVPKALGRPSPDKLEALYALRFPAAIFIALIHSNYFFEDNWQYPKALASQLLSFFFVLSGFVLAYNYKQLTNAADLLKYFRARLARLYPNHILCLALTFWVLGPSQNLLYPSLLVANALLLQGWYPAKAAIYSYDGPAWSLCCDQLFYLLFPVLLYRFSDTWRSKLLITAFIAIVPVAIAHQLKIVETSGWQLTLDWFTFTSPITRLSEFVIGMITAHFFLTKNQSQKHSEHRVTAIEIALFASIFAFGYADNIIRNDAHPQISSFIVNVGAAPLYAALIYVLSLKIGYISKILSIRVLAYSGCLTYALYLLHIPLVMLFNSVKPLIVSLSKDGIISLYWAVLLSISIICYELFEQPMNKLIRGQKLSILKKRTSLIVGTSLAVLLLSLTIFVSTAFKGFEEQRGINQVQLKLLQKSSLLSSGATHIGRNLVLESFNFDKLQDGSGRLTWTWRNEGNFLWLDKCVVLHLYDKNKRVFANHDFLQQPVNFAVLKNQIWQDKVHLTKIELDQAEACCLGVYQFQPFKRLIVEKGCTDNYRNSIMISLRNRKLPQLENQKVTKAHTCERILQL